MNGEMHEELHANESAAGDDLKAAPEGCPAPPEQPDEVLEPPGAALCNGAAENGLDNQLFEELPEAQPEPNGVLEEEPVDRAVEDLTGSQETLCSEDTQSSMSETSKIIHHINTTELVVEVERLAAVEPVIVVEEELEVCNGEYLEFSQEDASQISTQPPSQDDDDCSKDLEDNLDSSKESEDNFDTSQESEDNGRHDNTSMIVNCTAATSKLDSDAESILQNSPKKIDLVSTYNTLSCRRPIRKNLPSDYKFEYQPGFGYKRKTSDDNEEAAVAGKRMKTEAGRFSSFASFASPFKFGKAPVSSSTPNDTLKLREQNEEQNSSSSDGRKWCSVM